LSSCGSSASDQSLLSCAASQCSSPARAEAISSLKPQPPLLVGQPGAAADCVPSSPQGTAGSQNSHDMWFNEILGMSVPTTHDLNEALRSNGQLVYVPASAADTSNPPAPVKVFKPVGLPACPSYLQVRTGVALHLQMSVLAQGCRFSVCPLVRMFPVVLPRLHPHPARYRALRLFCCMQGFPAFQHNAAGMPAAASDISLGLASVPQVPELGGCPCPICLPARLAGVSHQLGAPCPTQSFSQLHVKVRRPAHCLCLLSYSSSVSLITVAVAVVRLCAALEGY
jgi:hypothetical protein